MGQDKRISKKIFVYEEIVVRESITRGPVYASNAYIIQCSKMLVIYARYHFYVESLVNEMQTKASFEVLEVEATIMFIVMFG